MGRVRLWADRRRGSDYIFGLKLVLAKLKNRSKLEEITKLSPERAVFSLVCAARNQKTAQSGGNFCNISDLEPRSGFEPETSSLPWKRSTN